MINSLPIVLPDHEVGIRHAILLLNNRTRRSAKRFIEMTDGRGGGRRIEGNTKVVQRSREQVGVNGKTERFPFPQYNTKAMAMIIILGWKEVLQGYVGECLIDIVEQ
jgi:hypothetical protein